MILGRMYLFFLEIDAILVGLGVLLTFPPCGDVVARFMTLGRVKVNDLHRHELKVVVG